VEDPLLPEDSRIWPAPSVNAKIRPLEIGAATVKGVILAGGEGTRLRPLTLGTPKPVIPVLDRPFLRHQIDLLARAGIREVIFSVAYKPERVREAFGDGNGTRIHYVVEDPPLGTGGAVKNAEALLDETTVVLNGDVLTDLDLASVIASHRARGAAATLVLTPVPNPSAYGLVETDASGRIRRFVEKPSPSEVTTDTINAGIYVLERPTLSLMEPRVPVSIERSFFPALIARGDLLLGHVHRGYWIDIGTPEKYLEVHRDILRGRFPVALGAKQERGGWIHPEARVHARAVLEGPFYVGPGCVVSEDARLGPDAALLSDVHLAQKAVVRDSILWEGCRVGEGAELSGAILGTRCRVGPFAKIARGAVFGEGAWIPDFSRSGS
jgi:NDP-sugar pyrophosphorylase family protein